MKRIFIVLALFALQSIWCLNAHATLYRLDYSGTITESDSPDYLIGNPVSGTFQIDLSKATRFYRPTDLLMFTSENNDNFIEGHFPQTEQEHFDSLYFGDSYNFNPPAVDPRVFDTFSLSDYNRKYHATYTYTESYIHVSSEKDWFSGSEAVEFELFKPDLAFSGAYHALDSSGGFFMSDELNPHFMTVRFSLNHVKFYSVDVPEPSSILSLSVAFLALIVIRIFKGGKNTSLAM